jgi:hypothetical protein
MVLFAYASNMNLEEFKEHIPSAHKLCNAYIPGYEFCFNKNGADLSAKANIQPSANPAAKAWGILIVFDDEHARFFHENEELEFILTKCFCPDGKITEAHAFISKPHAVNNYLLPYDWYKYKIVELTKLQQLPEDYIKQLEGMEAKKDPNAKRAKRRMEKIKKYL